MRLRPVTKLDKRNKTTSKKLAMMSCQEIVTSLSFFGFLVNLEQSGGRIRTTKSAKVTFPLIVTFCLRKNENRTIKNFNIALPLLLSVKVLFRTKNANFLAKKC